MSIFNRSDYFSISLLLTCCLCRTAETIARFIEPLTSQNEVEKYDQVDWVSKLAERMELDFSRPDNRAPKEIEKMIHLANSGRIYFEQLHLHPVRIGLTFTQEWMDWNAGAEEVMLFQFIRGMVSPCCLGPSVRQVYSHTYRPTYPGFNRKCPAGLHFVRRRSCFRGPSGTCPCYHNALFISADETDFWNSRELGYFGRTCRFYFECWYWRS